jgi:5-methylcytosine-specific restriction protein A
MSTGFELYPKLYGSSRWRKIAKMHLDSSPLCSPCLLSDKETPGTIVHHKIPHKGNASLFYDSSNLESVCASCHSGIKRIEDTHGYSQACGVDGLPLDSGHPWNVKR